MFTKFTWPWRRTLINGSDVNYVFRGVDSTRFSVLSTTVAVNICNVHVVVNLEFLLVLANVFTSALSADTPSAPVASGPAQTPAPASKPKSLGPSDEDPPQLRFQLSVKDPEIVLLADAKDKNTNALFLKASPSYPNSILRIR